MGLEVAAIGAIAGPLIGGVLGNIASGGDRDKANAAAQEAIKIIMETGAPPDQSKAILLDKFRQVGVLTPDIEKQIDVGFSQVSQIKEDPSLRNAQMEALTTLRDRSRTGLGPQDRAALNQIRSEVQRDQEAKRQQIIQAAQARGQAGGGAELLSQLVGSQGAANLASSQGDQVAAQASARALEALKASGQLGGQIRGQDFDVNKTRADAADQLKRFDLTNQVGLQQRNVANANAAKEFNLRGQQTAADRNTAMGNEELYRQSDAKRDYWNDQMKRAGMLSGAKSAEADLHNANAGRTAQMWQGIGSGAGSMFGALAGKMSSTAPTAMTDATKSVIKNDEAQEELERALRTS